MNKRLVLLKLTGTIFCEPKTCKLTRSFADQLAQQLIQLHDQYLFGIVVGGGDFFRGNEHNGALKIRPAVAHTVGMFGTVMNGLMLYDIFCSHGIQTTVLSALDCAQAGTPISQQAIDCALRDQTTIIFSGGIASPYVSTDTCAVMRALQMGAHQVWKASDVDGIYTQNPHKNPQAQKLASISYQDVIAQQLTFIDHTAIIIAQQNKLPIRVFDIFSPNALIKVVENPQYGSLIS